LRAMPKSFMTANEAREQSELNREVEDTITEQRVGDHIKEAISSGEFSVTIGYSVNARTLERLEENGYSFTSKNGFITIHW